MALTAQQKDALKTWLQANVYKAVHIEWYREGIKDGDGKPVYGVCNKLDADGNPVAPTADDDGTYWGRTFNVVFRPAFDWHEVVRRVVKKAEKQGLFPTEDEVSDFLRPYKDTILGWAGVTKVVQGIALPDSVIDAEDPDAV